MSLRLAAGFFLIQDEVFNIENPKLIQRTLLLFCVWSLGSDAFGLRDNFLKICRDNQAGAFLVNLGDAIAEGVRCESCS